MTTANSFETRQVIGQRFSGEQVLAVPDLVAVNGIFYRYQCVSGPVVPQQQYQVTHADGNYLTIDKI